ncbi:3-hydroxyacyl-CoA dehydrogenase NAD-binding domain-containing protein [Actinophytocola sp.]|uniref:3-hydroxyacyl-CoA dehydrogenase NAD-binding domain-containing protein n=1 Tax=Actinophytocola sp. TaxID=1872138 RepID=UPI002ED63938
MSAGTMGVGIAYVFAAAGAEVTNGEPDPVQAEGALAAIRALATRAVEHGKLNADEAEALPGRVRRVAAAKAAVSAIGKETIVVRDVPGFATSTLGVAIGLEAMRTLEEGVDAA